MANYTYAFDSGVYDTTNMGNPAPLNVDANAAGHGGTFPLSAANNSFALISAGKVNHEDVEGVLFNYVSVASAHPVDQDFRLESPGGPDHPDIAAYGLVYLSAAPAIGSYMQLQTTNGNLSTFYAVASGTDADNTGAGNIAGSVFYSNTGSDFLILQDLEEKINNHGAAGAFTAEFVRHRVELIIAQNTAGNAGNTTISVSANGATSNLAVARNFAGGQNEQHDATYIRAAAGTNSSQGYDGATVAVVTTTGRTVTYTLNHGGAVPPVLSGFNLATGPNMRRDVLLGYR